MSILGFGSSSKSDRSEEAEFAEELSILIGKLKKINNNSASTRISPSNCFKQVYKLNSTIQALKNKRLDDLTGNKELNSNYNPATQYSYSLEIVSGKLTEDIENLCLRCLERHNKSNLNFRNIEGKEKIRSAKLKQHYQNSEKVENASKEEIKSIRESISIQNNSYSIQDSKTLYKKLKLAHHELYRAFKEKEQTSANKQRRKYAGAAD